jgi:hypothetical protein
LDDGSKEENTLRILTRLFLECVSEGGRTYKQATAIVEKYVEDNPGKWHYRMAELVFIAVGEACPPKSK